jgi:alpha-D-ribose 1-methylphosphonate 5-triphosphate diphosphatase
MCSCLIRASFVLADDKDGMTLPETTRLVRTAPARAVGFDDRGRIGTGLRADLAQVRRDKGVPVVTSVWREGGRVV